jgi:NAD(P)-dependent dehydrogenase (short-subunit alcohol dehydrogenase family)
MASPLITTLFTSQSTAADVVAGVDLHGVRAIVTGASSGLGIETARVLASAGADVTLGVRNTSAGSEVAESIHRSTGQRPSVGRLDLADRASITGFVESWDGPLHLLINNAGIVTAGLERTPEARERRKSAGWGPDRRAQLDRAHAKRCRLRRPRLHRP